MKAKLNDVAANFRTVELGDTTIWFSYSEAIAFRIGGNLPVIRQNEWTRTTAKHIGMVPGSKGRTPLDSELFLSLLGATLAVTCGTRPAQV